LKVVAVVADVAVSVACRLLSPETRTTITTTGAVITEGKIDDLLVILVDHVALGMYESPHSKKTLFNLKNKKKA